MENVIKQIEEARSMDEVGEIVEKLYDYAYLQGKLSMVEVDSGRVGLGKSVKDEVIPEIEDKVGSTGFKSPKHRWSPELDQLVSQSALRGLDLQKLSEASEQGFTHAAIKSRLYRLGFKYRGGSWSRKEVA